MPGLSFRVRNGTGRLTWAMAAARISCTVGNRVPAGMVAVREPEDGRGHILLIIVRCASRIRVVSLSSASCGCNTVFQPSWVGVLCGVPPLVPVGSTPRGASTSGLSTTCSAWGVTSPRWGCRNAYLGAGFPLRCFQRLSLPNVANRPCRWRDNRHTRGSSTQVLSYYGQASSTFQRAQRIETKLSHDVLNPARVPL